MTGALREVREDRLHLLRLELDDTSVVHGVPLRASRRRHHARGLREVPDLHAPREEAPERREFLDEAAALHLAETCARVLADPCRSDLRERLEEREEATRDVDLVGLLRRTTHPRLDRLEPTLEQRLEPEVRRREVGPRARRHRLVEGLPDPVSFVSISRARRSIDASTIVRETDAEGILAEADEGVTVCDATHRFSSS